MGSLKEFTKNYLAPEDPLDWIITILIVGVTIGGVMLLMMMYSAGYLD